MVTCYDYTFARLLSETAIDGILVGDSVAMVMYGHPSTLSATVDLMRVHTEAVSRGAPGKFLVADLPFLSYRKGIPAALDAAQALMSAGAHALKLEGVDGHEDVIRRMTESGIPVMGHLGLQPQSVRSYGGFKIQGRGEEAAREIVRGLWRWRNSGPSPWCWSASPRRSRDEVTSALRIPTIGIGAGAACDGQILVLQDLLGMNRDFRPKFVRSFWDGAGSIQDAIGRFDADSQERRLSRRRGELPMMRVWRELDQWQERRRAIGGQDAGFVPTMGALHRGHASLVERCRAENQVAIASIFVNPTQFNDPRDLDRYPRTLERDLALLESLGVDDVLAPSAAGSVPQRLPVSRGTELPRP